MLTIKRSLMVLIALTLGCVSIDVYTEVADQNDFSVYRTYDWKEDLQHQPDDPRIDNTLLRARIRRAVERRFAELGYERRTSDTPDIYIGYHAEVNRRIESSKPKDYYAAAGRKDYLGGYRGRYGSYGQEWGKVAVPMPAYEYDQGVLSLDIIDAKSGKLVWRGWARAEINLWIPDNRRGKRIDEAIERILAEYPPG